MMSDTGGTLGELDVKVGDVVECVSSNSYLFTDGKSYLCGCDGAIEYDEGGKCTSSTSTFRIVSRATPQPDYNDGKWHGWNGGECPVHPDTQISACFMDGLDKPVNGSMPASSYDWDVCDDCAIIAFRATTTYVETKEPREYWIALKNGRVIDIVEEKPQDMYGYIRMREVTE